MKGCLGLLALGILILMLAGLLMRISGSNSTQAVPMIILTIVLIFILSFSIALCKKKLGGIKPAKASLNTANEDIVSQRIAELDKEATAKKKTDPNGAIRVLEQIERLQRGNSMHSQCVLDTRLRMATILYENDRFDEAEMLLLDELANARRMTISKATITEANRQYRERMESLKLDKEISGKVPQDWELLRNLNEWPDFERNLYCSAIYTKLRIFYTKMRRPDRAVVFAMAETYAGYENSTQQAHVDNPTPDFTAVEKLLRDLGNEGDIPQWEAFLLEYTKPEPTCERCWEMVDSITKSVENAG